MNLVIDDAVEVKQITKTNDKETRKSLGTTLRLFLYKNGMLATAKTVANFPFLSRRPNIVEG